MSFESARGSGRIRTLMATIVLLGGASVGCGTLVADQHSGANGGSAVQVLETTVTVTARVECRKYEGKILFCTVDPSEAVAKSLDVKLLLGYSSIKIDGNVYEVSPIAGAEARFVPQGEDSRLDVSGKREIEIGVIYVE